MTQEEIEKYRLQGSLKDFTEVFYYLKSGRKFDISQPISRESHHILIMKELVKVFRGETRRLIINVPPRYSKTTLLIHFIAWSYSQYPDSNFLYVSYSHSLAARQTHEIKQIMESSHYKKIMNVHLRADTQAKDHFATTENGHCYAIGSGGTVTGLGAGIQGCDRFGGIICLDDLLKPDEATSDVVREGVNEWYFNTLQSRVNSPLTPIVLIGQRLHEDDICARLIASGEWRVVSIPAIDEAGNALNPAMHDIQTLRKMQEENPYVFASQYQQNPISASSSLFKQEWFLLLEEEPDILATFVTCDTAETDKTYNDATAFGFFGVYQIKYQGSSIPNMYGLHWIDGVEIRVEPKDLQSEFMDFWASCMRYKVKPSFAAIEKRSSGTTLLSVLKEVQGLRLIDIERTRASGSKASRFLEMQPFIAAKQVSFPAHAKHTKMCIQHLIKINAAMTHRNDDLCDVLYDAIKMALIDKTVINMIGTNSNYEGLAAEYARKMQQQLNTKKRLYNS